MWIILPNLYLGDETDARNLDALEFLGVTHILNCAREIRANPSCRSLHLDLTDPDPEFGRCIPEICRYIEEGRKSGGVLVHCRMGRSRSPSAIVAYLYSRGNSLEEALELLESRMEEADAGFVHPHEDFLHQIEEVGFRLERATDG